MTYKVKQHRKTNIHFYNYVEKNPRKEEKGENEYYTMPRRLNKDQNKKEKKEHPLSTGNL